MPAAAAKRARAATATATGAAPAVDAAHAPVSPFPTAAPKPRHHGLTAVHRSRLVDWAVSPVAAIAPCPDGAHVAVGYGDGAVEVWDARAGFCRLARVPGEDGAELSALAWVPDALAAAAASSSPSPGHGAHAADDDDDDDDDLAAPRRRPPSSSSSPALPSLVSAWRLFAARLDGTIREVFPAALDPGGGLHSSSAAAHQHSNNNNSRRGTPASSAAAATQPQLLLSASSCVTDSYGGAVWALAAEPPSAVRAGFAAHLAAACDDGSVRLFAVEPGEPGVQYVGVIGRAAGEAADLGGAGRRAAASALAGRKRGEAGGEHSDAASASTIRCLSVAWHPSGAAVVAGCSDGLVRAWEAGPALGGSLSSGSSSRARGRELLRVSVGASSVAGGGAPCVWAVAVLPDGVLVTGASDGAVCFFEPRSGALLSRHARHHADVLALAVAPDGNGVYAAGVDARVALYARVGGQQQQVQAQGGHPPVQQQQQQPRQWQYLDYKAPHSHDVRALGVLLPPSAAAASDGIAAGRRGGAGGKRKGGRGGNGGGSSSGGDLGGALLFSGGADGQVMAYGAARQRFLKEHPARLTKAPQAPLIALAPAGGPHSSSLSSSPAAARLLSVRGRQADVWELGVAYAPGAAADPWQQQQQQQQQQLQGAAADEGAPLELAAAPRHLARLLASGPQHVAAAAISPDGQLVALSDPASGVRVYRLAGDGGGAVVVSRVRLAARPRPARRGAVANGGGSGQPDASLVLPPAVALAFVPSDPRTLVCADGSGMLRAVSLKGAMPGEDSDDEEEEDEDEEEPRVVGLVVATSPTRHAPPALASGGAYAALGMRPAVSHLAISPDGAWVAAATAGGGGGGGGKGGGAGGGCAAPPGAAVELFSLPGLKSHGSLLLVDPLAMPPLGMSDDAAAAAEGHKQQQQHDGGGSKRRKGGGGKAWAAAGGGASAGGPSALPPVAALAFSPDSHTLVVATAGNAVAAYDVRTRAPTAWTRRYAAAAAELLGTLPGAVAGMSFGGIGGVGGGDGSGSGKRARGSMVVYSPGGVAALDLGAPVGVGHLRGGGGGAPATGRRGDSRHHHRGRSAAKPPREGPGSAGVPPGASARGANGRVLLLENPCLFFGHSAPDEAVLLERPLSALLESLPPPLQRARYGS